MVEDPNSPDTGSRDLPPLPRPPHGVSFSSIEHTVRQVTGPPGRWQPGVHSDTPGHRERDRPPGRNRPGVCTRPPEGDIPRGESEDISCVRASKNHQCPRPNFRCLVYPQSTQRRYLHLLPLSWLFVYNLVYFLRQINCFVLVK